MEPINFFKLQAKNLLKDFQTRSEYIDEVDGETYYEYDPKYFDIEGICCDFDFYEDVYGTLGENNCTLMNAQHLIAAMLGFDKWTDLIKASPSELEIAKVLFENQNKVSIEDFAFFIASSEELSNRSFSAEEKLALLKDVYITNENYSNTISGYLIKK